MRSTPASRLLKLLLQQNMAHHVHVRFFFLRWEDFLGAWSVLISSAVSVQIYAKHMSRCRRFCVYYDCWFSLIASKIFRQHLGPSCSCSCSSCSRFSSEPNLVGMAVMMMMVQVARCQIHQLALPETQIIAATPRLFASSPALKGNVLRRFFAADGLQVRWFLLITKWIILVFKPHSRFV